MLATGDMRHPPVHISLEPFEQLEAAAALVRARYQRLAADDPELARNVAPATTEDLRLWHESGQLRAVRTRDTVVGLLAVAAGQIRWIDGDEINEEVINVEHSGNGYAALAQPYGQRRSRVIKVAYLSAQSIDSTFLQERPQNGPDAIGFWMRCSFPWASLPAARGRASFMIT